MDLRKLVNKFLRDLIIMSNKDESFYLYFLLSCIIEVLNIREYKEELSKSLISPTPAFSGFTKENLPVITYTPELIKFLKNIKKIKETDSFYYLSKHEVIHLISLHPIRFVEYIRSRNLIFAPETIRFLNIVADSLVNKHLPAEFIKKSGGIPAYPKNLTFEELADKYLEKAKQEIQQYQFSQGQDNNSERKIGEQIYNVNSKTAEDLLIKDLNINKYNNIEDIIYKELKKLINLNHKQIQELKRQVQQEIKNRIEQVRKTIGTVPYEIEEIIKEYKTVEIKIENESEFFSEFHEVERLFIYPNLVNPDLPVYRPFSGSKVLLIIDTSGSITREEAEYFFGVIKYLINKFEVLVIEIDSEIKNERPFRFTRTKCEKLIFKGRGGTVFTDLERLDEILKYEDKESIRKVIVLTDGHIWDFPKHKPLYKAEWIGVTTGIVPKNSPQWIKKWFEIKTLIERV